MGVWKMSYADDVFIKMCQDILENGTSTEGEKVRPVWEDGTPAYTIKKFAFHLNDARHPAKSRYFRHLIF